VIVDVAISLRSEHKASLHSDVSWLACRSTSR
jgi:hypothetical protein